MVRRCLEVFSTLFAANFFLLPLATAADSPDVSSGKPAAVSYHRDVWPILRSNCVGCHQGAKQLGDYLMTDFKSLVRGGEGGEAAIIPGDPDASYLIQQITLHDGVAEMPKAPAKPLHETEVELIRRWIAEGAKDDSPESTGPMWSADNPPQYAGPATLPSIDLSPDGRLLAVAGYHEVLLMNPTKGVVEARLVGLSPRINSVSFSPDGKRVAAAGGTPGELGELQVWDVTTKKLLLSRSVTYDTLSGCAWSHDGKLLAVGANDNVVRAFDAVTGDQVLFQGTHENWVRDTVFTRDSKHLISVARDMTCKLTEVETERFIDNITSITPGALSGGLTSVTGHPSRDEIVVGGADGIVKVYRIFRETKRQIGDDANLVRLLPKMNGRIRKVVVSDDGTKIAAVSTIDGKSEVCVWAYDFDGVLSKELKGILGKRVASRSAEETKKVEASRNAEVKELLRLPIPDAAVYSLALNDQGEVFIAANDGKIRHLGLDGKVKNTFPAATWESRIAQGSSNQPTTASFDARRWTDSENKRRTDGVGGVSGDGEAKRTAISWSGIIDVVIEPNHVRLESPYAYAQLVAIAKTKDGSTLDVTESLRVESSDLVVFETGGLMRPVRDGQGEVHVSIVGLPNTNSDNSNTKTSTPKWAKQTLSVDICNQADTSVDFVRDVNPVLSRLGCNQGTCHGAQKGKAGFRLSLRGYDPIFDLRALTDDLSARRINPAAPENSLMLRKPLGLTPHQGGSIMQVGDPYHAVLRQWIADGSKLNLESSRVDRLEIYPQNPVVQATDARQQVRIVAWYKDGSSRDVTREAFVESGNTDVATIGDGAVLHAVRRGEAPVLARFEGAYAATTLTVMGDRSGYAKPKTETWNQVDELVANKWERMKIVPSSLCDDAAFLRRVHLDLTGLPAPSSLVREFLADERPTRQKRSDIVDRLIGNEDYVEFWTNKWADLLQVNRKYLGVEGSQKYRDWIRTAVKENRPYDEFARQILTAGGSNNTNPPASYYKVLRTPEDTMETTTHLFLGIRFNCNKCHDHPFERWTQDQYYEMAAFFARIDRKRDPASGKRNIGGSAVEKATPLFEIIEDSETGDVEHARTGSVVDPAFPYDLESAEPDTQETLTAVVAKNDKAVAKKELTATAAHSDKPETRREQLAQWMTHPRNPYFARSYVNRLWAYLTGVGLIEPIDDIRAGNPPTNPELLDYLTNEFVASGFDTRHMIRMICNSRVYGLSVETNPLNTDDKQNYSHAIPRRLPAEVIYDAVHALTGSITAIPGMPKGTRAAAATDSGVKLTDGFLANLGRPARESACECERSDDLQLGPVMALISGPTIGSAISDPKNQLEQIVQENPSDQAVAEEIFLRALGRFPSQTELAAFAAMTGQIKKDHEQVLATAKDAEADWKQRRPKLETQRLAAIEKTKAEIAARTKAIAPERKKLAETREKAIQASETRLAQERAKLPKRVTDWIAKNPSSIEWFPLAPKAVNAFGRATLTVLPDRSVLSSGKKENTTYQIDFETSLNNITGLRIEALTDPSLPGNGPGRATNFVVTEVETLAGKATSKPDEKPALKPVKIMSGKADFLQNGFNIALTYDGNKGNQNAWAVSGANGVEHWATFQFEQPIKTDGLTHLRLNLAQTHNAKEHLLGRFRISVTTATGEIPLSLTEGLAAAASVDEKLRSEAQKTLLEGYVGATDKQVKVAQAALAKARQPVPKDSQIVSFEAQLKRLEVETPDDPKLVQLRKNLEQSKTQIKHLRLTAAEDLTWALVNSPAFLFNH